MLKLVAEIKRVTKESNVEIIIPYKEVTRMKFNKVAVRISDNVLEDTHWTIYELEFSTRDVTKVIKQELVVEGVYGELLLGKSITDLCKWNKEDLTRHPTIYREIYDWRKERYRSELSVIDIRQLIEGDKNSYVTNDKASKQSDRSGE